MEIVEYLGDYQQTSSWGGLSVTTGSGGGVALESGVGLESVAAADFGAGVAGRMVAGTCTCRPAIAHLLASHSLVKHLATARSTASSTAYLPTVPIYFD